jgi:putative isomerase
VNVDVQSPYLKALRNRITLKRVPFSDRGSRLLVYESEENAHLMVRLAERLTDIEPGLAAYLTRPPFVEALRLIDEEGTPLEFEMTTYPHAVFFKTRLGNFGLTFQDARTIAIGLPPKTRAGVCFVVAPHIAHQYPDGGDIRAVRNLSYTTNANVLRNQVSHQSRGHMVEFIVESDGGTTIALNILHEDHPLSRQVVAFPEALAAAEARWHRWFDVTPNVDIPYRAQYLYAWWIMGNNLVSPQGYLAHEAMMPSKSQYVGVWQWDAYLHALAYRHVDPELAENQFRTMLAYQLDDGMIPDAIYDEGVVAEMDTPIRAEVTKPPIVAWAALKLHATNPNPVFLREIYGPLVRWNSWWFGMNDDDADGLAQYNHPYSSGLDDSPLWDGGMPVESPELNTYLCLQQQALAGMADVLNMPSEADMWRRRATNMTRRIVEHFYDPEAGLFWATRDHEPIRILTPFSLYPLMTGSLDEEIVTRLVNHLTDPGIFWTKYPIPTVAISDPYYDPQTMWRGPTWVNINYLFIEGLMRAGYRALACELRDRTLDLLMSQDDIYEYYHPETSQPPPKAAPVFGWSAAILIDLAIQASRGGTGCGPPEEEDE